MIATPPKEYRTWLIDGLMIKKHIENICFFYKNDVLYIDEERRFDHD